MNLLRSYVFLASIFLFSNILECYASSLEPIKDLELNFTFPKEYKVLDIQKAANVILNLTEVTGILLHIYNRPLIEVMSEIQEKYGVVELDCSLFIQIYQYILCGSIREPKVPLLMGSITPQFMEKFVSDKSNFSTTTRIVYMSFDTQASELITQLPLFNKAQWLINKGDDLWVGMGSEFPLQGTLMAWANSLKMELHQEFINLSIGTHPALINNPNREGLIVLGNALRAIFEKSDIFKNVNITTSSEILPVK